MEARFFIVRRDGVEDGPFTEEEVLDLLDTGELSRDDWCRVADLPHAQPLGEIFETIRITPGESDGSDGSDGSDESDEADGADYAGTGLPDEEETVYRGAPSFLGYGGPLIVAAGVLALGYWAGAYGVAWIVGAVAVAFLLIARVLVHRAAREYVVTTERVESTRGLLTRETRTIRLRDLESIRLLRPWPLGWFGVGTVVFSAESGDSEDVVFERIRGVRGVIALVQEWQKRQPRV